MFNVLIITPFIPAMSYGLRCIITNIQLIPMTRVSPFLRFYWNVTWGQHAGSSVWTAEGGGPNSAALSVSSLRQLTDGAAPI